MTVVPWHDGDFNPDEYHWQCVDCGYQTNSRWLMCPECTTDEDWSEMRAAVAASA